MSFNDGFSTQGVPFITGTTGQVLTWDGTQNKWIAADPTGGGGGGPSTVYTSGNISGDGSLANKIVLNTDISLTSVTASFKGNLNGTASYANDADTLDGYQSTSFAITGSNVFNADQTITGSLFVQNVVSASQFSGSFFGDASGLTGVVTSVGLDRVIYVQQGASSTGADGTVTNPFPTISSALAYASSSYSDFSNPVVIEVGPGSYAENITIDRHNTYIRSSAQKSEQREVSIVGKITIDCPNASSKYTQIVGLEGLFISNGSDITVTITGTGEHTTYLKDCYLYNSSTTSNTHCLNIAKSYTTQKVIVQNSIINLSKSAPTGNGINLTGGDLYIDSLQLYYSGTSVGDGNGIKISGTSGIIADRVLIELNQNVRGYTVENTVSTTFDSTSAPIPSLYISNSSLRNDCLSAGYGILNVQGSTVFLWNILFGVFNNTIDNKTSAADSYVYYGSISGPTGVTFSNYITRIPLIEYFGTVKSVSLSASSGITGSFNGNGAAITGILTSSIPNFSNSVRSLFSGSGIISYNTSSGEISAPSAMTGVLTSGNITGSGVSGNPVTLKDTVELVGNLTASNAYIQNKLIVNGTASIAYLETLNQQSLVIGDKYIVIMSGAVDHVNLDGSGVLWGSGAIGDPTQGPEGENAYIRYKNSGDQLEIFPGLRVSGSLTASNGISSSAGFYGDGSGLTGVTASAFPGISNYPTKTEVSATFAILTGSNTFSGPSNTFTNIVTASGGVSGSFTGSLNGTASYASNAGLLGTYPASAFAFTGSANTFTAANTFNGPITASGGASGSFTGSFKGNGSQLTNLTGSSWSSTSAFFSDVRDAFIFDTNSFTTGSSIGGRYPITASGGGGSSAGAQLTYVQTITGSSPLPTLSSGMIVGVSGANVVKADNSNLLSSNIVGVVSGTSAGNIIISIAGEVSASKSGSTAINGGTPVYLSDDPGKYTTYDNVGTGKYIVQIGILGPLDNKVILQPRIFGIKG